MIRSEIVRISPELAAEWLRRNTRNRTASRSAVERIVQDIRAGQWRLTHQGIAFFDDGTLADGQHRLLAIVETGETLECMVTYGLSTADVLAVDGGRIRAAHDLLQISGVAPWAGKDHVAVARLFAAMLNVGNRTIKADSASGVEVYLRLYRSSVEFGVAAFPSKRKYVTSAIVMAAVGAASAYESRHSLCSFAQVMFTGQSDGAADSGAIRAREYLLSSSTSTSGGQQERLLHTKRIQRAIQAFCARKPLSQLRMPQEFIYPPKKDIDVEVEA